MQAILGHAGYSLCFLDRPSEFAGQGLKRRKVLCGFVLSFAAIGLTLLYVK
jgi:hypothetical protein